MNSYFKEAKTWADDQFGRVRQTCKRYQMAFLASMGLNLVSMLAISILAHYQTLLPILVHHYENGITTVEPVAQKNIPTHRLQVESDIARYVQHREAYDASSYRAQFELVQLLSSSEVQKEYSKEQGNKDAPIRLLGQSGKREVHIYSIHFLDTLLENENDIHKDHHDLAEVVFSITDSDHIRGKTSESHFTALLSWRFVTPSQNPETRWQNWDGFEITRYSKSLRSVEHSS